MVQFELAATVPVGSSLKFGFELFESPFNPSFLLKILMIHPSQSVFVELPSCRL